MRSTWARIADLPEGNRNSATTGQRAMSRPFDRPPANMKPYEYKRQFQGATKAQASNGGICDIWSVTCFQQATAHALGRTTPPATDNLRVIGDRASRPETRVAAVRFVRNRKTPPLSGPHVTATFCVARPAGVLPTGRASFPGAW